MVLFPGFLSVLILLSTAFFIVLNTKDVSLIGQKNLRCVVSVFPVFEIRVSLARFYDSSIYTSSRFLWDMQINYCSNSCCTCYSIHSWRQNGTKVFTAYFNRLLLQMYLATIMVFFKGLLTLFKSPIKKGVLPGKWFSSKRQPFFSSLFVMLLFGVIRVIAVYTFPFDRALCSFVAVNIEITSQNFQKLLHLAFLILML